MKQLRILFRLLWLVLVVVFGMIMAALLLRGRQQDGSAAARITQYWHQLICNGFHVEIKVNGKPPHEPALIIANHISWFDITAIGSATSARFLSKDEVSRWPVIGWLARKAGTLFIKRGASQALQSIHEMAGVLKAGEHVVLFPEGTTTTGESVRRFHPRLMQSAIEAGVHIVPVIIRYPGETGTHPKAPYIDNMHLLQSATGMLAEKNMQAELFFLEPVDTKNRKRDELSAHCEKLFRETIATIENNRSRQQDA